MVHVVLLVCGAQPSKCSDVVGGLTRLSLVRLVVVPVRLFQSVRYLLAQQVRTELVLAQQARLVFVGQCPSQVVQFYGCEVATNNTIPIRRQPKQQQSIHRKMLPQGGQPPAYKQGIASVVPKRY